MKAKIKSQKYTYDFEGNVIKVKKLGIAKLPEKSKKTE